MIGQLTKQFAFVRVSCEIADEPALRNVVPKVFQMDLRIFLWKRSLSEL